MNDPFDLTLLAEIESGNEDAIAALDSSNLDDVTEPEVVETPVVKKLKKVWVASMNGGLSVTVNNMKKFCAEKDLNYQKIVTGKTDKGWSAMRSDKD